MSLGLYPVDTGARIGGNGLGLGRPAMLPAPFGEFRSAMTSPDVADQARAYGKASVPESVVIPVLQGQSGIAISTYA